MKGQIVRETCDQCRFEANDYTRADLLGTLRSLGRMWRTMTEHAGEETLATAPEAGVWSALQYASHSRDVTKAMGLLLNLLLTTEDTVSITSPSADMADPDAPATMADAVSALEANADRLARKAAKMTSLDWARTMTLDGVARDLESVVAHGVHDAVHHLRDVGRGLVALGAGAPNQVGTVVQLSASGGGVPKDPLSFAHVTRRGITGDRQANRAHHGRPFQALCIYSEDVIAALRAEGHPIYAGAAGENITVSGVDWTTIRPGVRMRVGTVLAEISAFAIPCAQNSQWFADRDSQRILHDRHPGWSRAYAWVLDEGTVEPGDQAVVEPVEPIEVGVLGGSS